MEIRRGWMVMMLVRAAACAEESGTTSRPAQALRWRRVHRSCHATTKNRTVHRPECFWTIDRATRCDRVLAPAFCVSARAGARHSTSTAGTPTAFSSGLSTVARSENNPDVAGTSAVIVGAPTSLEQLRRLQRPLPLVGQGAGRRGMLMMAQPRKKLPERSVDVCCTKCKFRLYKYKKGGKGSLVKCYKERIVEDFTEGCLKCPGCGQEFARPSMVHGKPAYKMIGGKVFQKK